MRSGLLCSTFAAAILVTGAASAADLGRPAPAPVYTKAAPLQATCIWCGFYAGVDAGYAWSRSDPVDTTTSATPTNGNPVFALISPLIMKVSNGSVPLSTKGFIGGGQ